LIDSTKYPESSCIILLIRRDDLKLGVNIPNGHLEAKYFWARKALRLIDRGLLAYHADIFSLVRCRINYDAEIDFDQRLLRLRRLLPKTVCRGAAS